MKEDQEVDVIRVNTTLVTVPVSVRDRDGRYIPDLQKEDFQVYEEGIEQEIAYFATVEKAVLKGWPLGSDAFKKALEHKLKRQVLPAKRGRPFKTPVKTAGE